MTTTQPIEAGTSSRLTRSATTDASLGLVPARSMPRRIWAVVRLHLVNRRIYLGIPWIIVAGALVLSILVALIFSRELGSGEMSVSAAVLAPMWYLAVVAIQAISLTLPFALGFGVTRRDFYLGTSLLFVLISAFNSAAFTLLTQVERLTGGWGVGAAMFGNLWFGKDGWYVDLLAFFSLQMFYLFSGAAIATVYLRWRMWGMLVFWGGVTLLVIGVLALLSWVDGWPSVTAWFAVQGAAGPFAWLLVLTGLAAVTGYLVLRRATPKG